ncbi:MAG: antitoxin VapB family protein [Gammaproteobacteria bacterium]|nr:antitoxin VapB family protein [Gammaproteobacteria bacterium]
MSKTIKLSDKTYNALEDLREKRETFDEAVQRLLNVFRTLKEASDILGPGHYLKSPTPPRVDRGA